MIRQRVTLKKLKTDDGRFDFTHAQMGLEFWIECNTFRVMPYRNRFTGETFNALTVQVVEGPRVPVEMLHFEEEFEVA